MSSYRIVKENRPDDHQPLKRGTIGRYNGDFDAFLVVLELIIPTELYRTLRLKESELIPLVAGQPLALTPVVKKIKEAIDLVYFAVRTKCSKEKKLYWNKCQELLTSARNDLKRFHSKGFPEEPVTQLENALTNFMYYRRDHMKYHKQGLDAVQCLGTAVLLAREWLLQPQYI
ncbi:MAG: hypothetical protein FVQ84_04885 [Planctomycetes bacterium]|nr:hypothetical protein [Planctomycetota bacterium]